MGGREGGSGFKEERAASNDQQRTAQIRASLLSSVQMFVSMHRCVEGK